MNNRNCVLFGGMRFKLAGRAQSRDVLTHGRAEIIERGVNQISYSSALRNRKCRPMITGIPNGGPFGPTRPHMGPYGATWCHLRHHGAWHPYLAMFDHMAPHGTRPPYVADTFWSEEDIINFVSEICGNDMFGGAAFRTGTSQKSRDGSDTCTFHSERGGLNRRSLHPSQEES